jgi:hypothetical protein
MSVRLTVAFAALAATLAPAAAADFGAPLAYCAPPTAYTRNEVLQPTFKEWAWRQDRPRIVDVERFDPHNPPPTLTPTYVIPQTAYLASQLCDFPFGTPQRSWYDGKLFYRPGGERNTPDTFMVIERD